MMKCNEATTTVVILHFAETFEMVLQICDVANAENTAFMLLVWLSSSSLNLTNKPEPKNKRSVIFSFSPRSGHFPVFTCSPSAAFLSGCR